MYQEKLKELLIMALKGMAIGLVLALIIQFTLFRADNEISTILGQVFAMTVFFGLIATIIICTKSGTEGFINSAASRGFSGLSGVLFGGMVLGSPLLFALSLIKMVIGAIIMVPILIYMGISFVFNLIYIIVMCILEKNGKLNEKEDLCEILDKVMPILSIIVTIIICILIIKWI